MEIIIRFTLRKQDPAGCGCPTEGTRSLHISYEHDVDTFLDGTRGMLLERIMGESGLQWDGGAFCLDTPPERLPEAIFAFGQALTRVYDLTLLSRTTIGSTFYDDLADILFGLVDETKIERNYQPEVPNTDAYLVDYRIEGRDNVPLFLYGVPNRGQGTPDNDHAVAFSPTQSPLRVHPRVRGSGGDSETGLGKTLRRRRRHDLVAGVAGGFQPKSPAARRRLTSGGNRVT